MVSRLRAIATSVFSIAIYAAAVPALAIPISPPRVTIWNDGGGHVVVYALKMLKLKESGVPVEFSGRCASACTLYLALPKPQTCLSSHATFRFHVPYGGSRRANAVAAAYLLRTYPSWVRSWIHRNGGLSSRVLVMKYDYASRFLRTCQSS